MKKTNIKNAILTFHRCRIIDMPMGDTDEELLAFVEYRIDINGQSFECTSRLVQGPGRKDDFVNNPVIVSKPEKYDGAFNNYFAASITNYYWSFFQGNNAVWQYTERLTIHDVILEKSSLYQVIVPYEEKNSFLLRWKQIIKVLFKKT